MLKQQKTDKSQKTDKPQKTDKQRNGNGNGKHRLLDRLGIRGSEGLPPPVPFDSKIRRVKRCLTIAIALAAGMLVVCCLVPIEDIYTAEGIVRPGSYRRLYAAGDLEQREGPLVKEGDEVKAGQELMRFHLPELEYKIEETRELLGAAKAELAVQKANTAAAETMPLPKEMWEIDEQLAQTEASRAYYERQLARSEELGRSGAISEKDVDQARLEAEQSQIAHERLKQRLEIIEAGYSETLLAEARAQEDRISQRIDGLNDRLSLLEKELARLSVLRAPADGLVLDMPYKNVIGVIKSGQELVYMAIGDGRMIEIFGLQENFDRVKVGQSVRYKSKVYDPMKFGYAGGRVAKIGQIRGTPSGGTQADRYYSILATIEKQPKELTLDSNVTAQVILRKDRLVKVLFGVN